MESQELATFHISYLIVPSSQDPPPKKGCWQKICSVWENCANNLASSCPMKICALSVCSIGAGTVVVVLSNQDVPTILCGALLIALGCVGSTIALCCAPRGY